MNRRDLLVAGSTSLLLRLGGCLDTPGGGTEPKEESNDENERQEHNDGNWDYSGFTVRQFAVSATADWWSEGTDRTGHVELFTSRESALDVLDFERVDEERREAVKSSVENTHYGGVAEYPGEGLLYVESVGPQAGYDEIEIPELTNDSTIAGTVKAKQASEDREEEVTFPSALVQSVGSASRYDITVIDGWGNEAEVRGTAHDPHAPIELESISWYNEYEPGYEYDEAIRRSDAGSTLTDSFELRGALHALYFDAVGGLPSGFTVDLVPTGSDESETRLVDLETIPDEGAGWNHGGQFAFVPEEGTYRLDVRCESEWEMTIIDLAAFRSNTGFEAVTFGEGEEIHARGVTDEVHVNGGGWNGVVGAVRLSPGMRIKLVRNRTKGESGLPPAVTAYTEPGQREVLFAETRNEGQL